YLYFLITKLFHILVQGEWTVTYSATQICALKGSTVEINCIYRYPFWVKDQDNEVEQTFWFAKLQNNEPVDLRTDSEYSGRVQYDCGQNDCTLRITDLRESDSAEYKFRFTTNQPGGKYTGSPGVTLSVTGSVSEVNLGRSITLTCSSDANPAAKYRWYKEDQILVLKGPHLVLNNLRSSDSGQYHCTAENELGRRTSGNISINVESTIRLPPSPIIRKVTMIIFIYTAFICLCASFPPDPPKNISVSVSPSAEMVEGSSVNLTCSSDANPAANITWYKEGEDSPKASGQIFTITDLRPEHSGNYYCEVQNTRGRRRSALYLTFRICEFQDNDNDLYATRPDSMDYG
uniref:B-cell receptor CD22 n=1 Tax=Echeneis naucrates TaxID=173247 RepID=A0A665UEY9_ECHNA